VSVSATAAAGQLRPLVSLRWHMVRAPRARRALLGALLLVPTLCVGAVAAGLLAPTGAETEVAILTPSILLAFLGLAILAPLAAGGGTELYPPDQLVAFPIRPSTVFRGSLLLAPLNLAWLLQVLAALGLTTYVVSGPGLDGSASALTAAAVTMLIYVAVVTVIGQSVAWLVVGLRQTRRGRFGCWAVLGAFGLLTLALLKTGTLARALDRAPTRRVYFTALFPAQGHWGLWAVRLGLLVLLGALCVLVGERCCRWALDRPGDAATAPESRIRTRRPLPHDQRRALVVLTRRGIWRSRSLRRGMLVLGLLPGAVLATAGVGWDSLLLLPGLVAAGAGMLFGINAFCLDATGATWLATLPHEPSTTFWSRAQVVAEVCAVTVLVAVTAGAFRAPAPSLTQLTCFIAVLVVAVLRASATCMYLSVTRPHRAQLLGPRDAPAPPGAMAVYSVRLATSAALVGVVFTAIAELHSVALALVVSAAFVLLSARSLLRTSRLWADDAVRARVVATVASG